MAKKKKTTQKTAKKTTAKAEPAKKPDVDVEVTPYPTAERVNDFERAIDLKLGKTANAQGRPSAEQKDTQARESQAEQVGVQLNKNVLAKGIRCPFALWAEAMPTDELRAKIRLADDEAADLADAIMPLLAYYAGDIKPVVLLWSVAGLNAFSVLQPRVAALGQYRREKRRREQLEAAARNRSQQPSFHTEPADAQPEPVGPTGFPTI